MGTPLFVPKEADPKETRVALVPDVASKLVKCGFEVFVAQGAGERAGFDDESYSEAGGVLLPPAEGWQKAGIVLSIGYPALADIAQIPVGGTLIGFLNPKGHEKEAALFCDRKLTSFAIELIPRISRAQSMDALSSQATVAGYKAALLAAHLSPRFFPMLTTAAGTIRPAKILVIGAGVAGLTAIATARRLGGVVEAYDVRKTVKEQVESLGARFVENPLNAEAAGGYARELSEEEKMRERELVARHVSRADVIITTAHVPSHKAPLIISEEMVKNMRPGSVIIDLAAESGGNCQMTVPGENVVRHGITIAGPLNLPATLPVHASEMFAKNIFHFLMLLTKEGKSLDYDFSDPVISGAVLTHAGEIKNELARVAVYGGVK
ncbi:MAG: Re/Si-specific NAD(P)(+) transhydrogenase subunit alpha [Deltaproteobacteria bacterium]|nr:Re/Si-specific NAD(P)(+) transhydrogenase subunit alpha [Deltaproteobacteria bacterium]